MMRKALVLAALVAVPDLTLGFQPIHSVSPSLPDGNERSSNLLGCDIDSQRRRQILFSMLYGSAALSSFSPSAAVAEPITESDSPAEGTADDGPINILRPPKDDREYFTYTLDNGLRVLLCSDPSSNEAAAAMDVHVGACSDPVDIPGMAHFTEHMSFLGSKPYPKEDGFSSFLSANGGSSNAYTDSEDTVYYFSMEAEADGRLSEGLDIFGSLFTSPLFTESATGRELNAIESENAKNLQTDSFRAYQLTKSRANSDHPFSKFFTGNKKTLLDDTKAKGINLRKELINFYNRYYSANQMSLAIVAPQPINKLKDMVKKSFSGIPNKDVGKPEEEWRGIPPYNGNSVVPSLQSVVEVVPVQDIRQLALSWPVLYQSEDDRRDALLEKQANYVAHLIGHEGPGSLLSYLKRKQWANALSSATETELADYETFEVVVGLTTSGLANVEKVVEAIFSYINMLRESPIPDYVFQEVLQTNELEWRFMSKGSAGGYVQSLAPAMQKYPPSLVVAGPRRIALAEPEGKLLDTSNPRTAFSSRAQLQATKESVKKYVSNLSLDNVMMTVMSKSFEGKTDKTEKWYGTEYSARPIPIETLMKWQNCPSPKSFKIDYPRPNVFIPSETGLRVKIPPKEKPASKDFETRITPIPPPGVIRDDGPDGRWTVNFKADDRFGQPKAFVVFELLTSEVSGTAYKSTLSTFYDACVFDRLGEYAYDAGLAGLTYDVKVLPRGVRLTFGGYNDKLQKFAAYVSQKISKDVKSILPKTEAEFDRYKDQIKRALSAFDVKQPYAHASYYANLNIQPLRFQYTNQQLREATEKATLQDLVSYATTVWSSGKGQALVQGNLNEQEAQELVRQLDKTLGFKSIPQIEVPDQLKPLPLPTPAKFTDGKPSSLRRTRLVVAEPNPVNANAASYVMVQNLGESAKDHVIIELISSIVEQPFYDELRTRQQLGYIVSSGVRALGRTRTFAFIVQSSVAPVEKLTTETLKYMDGIRDRLDKLPKVELGTYVKGLIDRKLEPDKTLASEVMRNWAEIASDRLEFDRVQREALALLEVNKSDLLEFWDRIYVGRDSRVLITQIVPRSGPASSPEPPKSFGYSSLANKNPPEGLVLGEDDIEAFRRDLEAGMA
ncbi:degrading enzyme-like 1, peroxisomal [Seminavis robusta]|uniref:Degrading enzyme-like 1, peroxisomal n=1 Tax=Seminavis robusta TaxID=568900 RepID=A0A9N8DHA5_9STRA|nr:degrading enzyme-like 1, peroxisomal [Seminavis robusta]|eukprot:Sro152_g069520.1 degrading enzyme-like 1, peroxisomal (1124) ;mRNA; f:65510-69195